MKGNLKDIIEEAKRFFDIEIEPEEGAETGLYYLESMTQSIGGSLESGSGLDFDKIGEKVGNYEKKGNYVTVGDEIRKSAGCGKNALEMAGKTTGNTYYRFMYCYRWLCEKCGSKGGLIHMKRLSKLFVRIAKVYSGFEVKEKGKRKPVNLRQLVFTLPMEIRKYFETRKDIQALCKMCERINAKMFPEKPSLRYFHGFGDESKGVYNPHVNIHTFEFEESKLWLEKEDIEDLKYRYTSALKAYIYQVYGLILDEEIFKNIDIHYSYLESEKTYKRWVFDKETKEREQKEIDGLLLIIHRIKYMCIPHPGYRDFDVIKQNEKMLRLFVIKMKGFRYISGCGKWGVKDEEENINIKESEALAGEELKVVYDKQNHPKYITRAEFDIQYIEKDYEELAEGFYRIKKVVKKVIDRKKGKCYKREKGGKNG